jgi:predicted DNA binding CopG/RHH family protein
MSTDTTRPDTTTLDELREHYDHTDQAAALADATHETATGPVLVSTSIRLPKTLMDAVRARAAAAGVPATTLMRDWITARIEADDSAEQVVSVADIQKLIATRAHPVAS